MLREGLSMVADRGGERALSSIQGSPEEIGVLYSADGRAETLYL
jgi:hypothetical protein